MSRLRYLIKKEFIKFRRNKFLSRLVFLFPIVVMLVIPIVATMDVKNVNLAVVDLDGSSCTRRILSHLEAAKSLRLKSVGADYSHAFDQLEAGKVDIIITLPKGCERTLALGSMPSVKLDANAVNSTKSGIGSQYVTATLMRCLQEELLHYNPLETTYNASVQPTGARPLSIRFFYNETLDYRFYMIPAFIIILILLICCFIPALNLVIEKEKGTIEQINVTPVGRMEFTLSKLIPYWIIGVVVLTEAILTVGIVYGLWPEGNVGTIYLAALVFALAMSGFAVAVANISDTMQQCVFVLFFFVMLFMLMSGLLTPLGSMPNWAQWITVIFPPRWFVGIMRAVYLKGTTWMELGVDFSMLSLLAILFSLLAAVTYKKQR